MHQRNVLTGRRASRMFRIVAMVLALALTVTTRAGSDVDESGSMALKEKDRMLNDLYTEKLSVLKGVDKIDLQRTQREWLVSRNTRCGIDPEITGRDDWISVVSQDRKKTDCLVRVTSRRIIWLSRIKLTAIPSNVEEKQICHFLGKALKENNLTTYLDYYNPRRSAGHYDSGQDTLQDNYTTTGNSPGKDTLLQFVTPADKERLKTGLIYTLVEQELDGDGKKDLTFVYVPGTKPVHTNHGRIGVSRPSAPRRMAYYRNSSNGYHFIGEEYRSFPFIDHQIVEGVGPGQCSPRVTYIQRDQRLYKVTLFGACNAVQVKRRIPRAGTDSTVRSAMSIEMTTGIGYEFGTPNRLVVSNYRRRAFRSVCGITTVQQPPKTILNCRDTDLCVRANKISNFPRNLPQKFSVDHRQLRGSAITLDRRSPLTPSTCGRTAYEIDIDNDGQKEMICQSSRKPLRLYFFRKTAQQFEFIDTQTLLGGEVSANCYANWCEVDQHQSWKIMRYNDVNYLLDFQKGKGRQSSNEFIGKHTLTLFLVAQGRASKRGTIVYKNEVDYKVHFQ